MTVEGDAITFEVLECPAIRHLQKLGLKISPVTAKIRPGLKLSSMGMQVMFRELLCLAGVLWRIRIKKSY